MLHCVAVTRLKKHFFFSNKNHDRNPKWKLKARLQDVCFLCKIPLTIFNFIALLLSDDKKTKRQGVSTRQWCFFSYICTYSCGMYLKSHVYVNGFEG